jgi:cytochrome P450
MLDERRFDYDPFAQAVMNDPLPFYKVLRADHPAYFIPKYDSWIFSRFDDVVELLTMGENALVGTDTSLPPPEALLSHNEGVIRPIPLNPLPVANLLGSPHYEVLRQAHLKPFKPKAVAALRGQIERLANELLDDLLPRGRFDLTQDYGGIISAGMVCHLFDLPLALAREVLTTVNTGSITDPEKGGVDTAAFIAGCMEIILPAVAARRAAGADGSVPTIDGLLNLDYYARPLTDEEVGLQLACVFIGGTETAPKVAAHGLMELANRPDQLAEVRTDLDTNVDIAVEEILRFCAPAQWFARTAQRDVVIGGQTVAKGQRVFALVGSAARDEAEFDDPDAFVWNRPIDRQIAFGMGQRHCIGVHLARLEVQVAVREFLKRVPRYRFDMAGAVRRPSSFQWGWNNLPVIIG